jgi:predicted ester cyclase
MSEENKAIVRRYLEAFNNQTLGVIDEVVADGFVDHHYPPELPRGPEGPKLWWNALYGAFPDGREKIEDVVADDIPATGKPFSISGISIARVADGKLVEWWENADALGMMQQVGVIPS